MLKKMMMFCVLSFCSLVVSAADSYSPFGIAVGKSTNMKLGQPVDGLYRVNPPNPDQLFNEYYVSLYNNKVSKIYAKGVVTKQFTNCEYYAHKFAKRFVSNNRSLESNKVDTNFILSERNKNTQNIHGSVNCAGRNISFELYSDAVMKELTQSQ
jgi:hypothetical protein